MVFFSVFSCFCRFTKKKKKFLWNFRQIEVGKSRKCKKKYLTWIFYFPKIVGSSLSNNTFPIDTVLSNWNGCLKFLNLKPYCYVIRLIWLQSFKSYKLVLYPNPLANPMYFPEKICFLCPLNYKINVFKIWSRYQWGSKVFLIINSIGVISWNFK